jgi:hypothetical protein
MSKKPVKVGKELVKRTQDLNKNIETIMGKVAKSQTFNIIDDDEVTLTLSTYGFLISVDFCNESFKQYFEMDLDRQTLKGMADFIYKYLEE